MLKCHLSTNFTLAEKAITLHITEKTYARLLDETVVSAVKKILK